MQPKFTQRNGWYFCSRMVTLLLFLATFNQLTLAQDKPGAAKKADQKRIEANGANAAPSVGPAPIQVGSRNNDILPDIGNPASRAFCYNGAGPFQLNKQSVLNTTLTPIGAPVSFGFPGASAWVTTTNKLYVVDQASPWALYTVDTLTGVRTFIANCTGVPHANLTGMTWDASTNTMYGVSTDLATSRIFTINIATGVCTPIGSNSAVAPGVIMINAAPGGTLFSSDIVTDNLYRWNKTTGVPTLIGPLGFNANFGQDGHFDLSDGQYYYACYNATAGQAQLRIVDTLSGGSTLVGTYGGQIETFSIYNPPLPPCAGTPNPGNTISSTAVACPADLFTLSLQNNPLVSGLTFQWQTAPAAGGPWTNAPGSPNTAYWTLSQSVPTWYRCQVTCSGNTGTSTPVFVDQNPFYNCYCVIFATNAADEDLFNVTIGTLNNSSTCATTGPGPGSVKNRYSNYRTPIAPSDTGRLVTGNMNFSVQVGTCGGNFSNAVGIWIDYNHNGRFDDPAERFYRSNSTTVGPHIESGTGVIPTTALSGFTGMRVISAETAPANILPCNTYTWGETEDYLVDIQPCVPLPVTGVTAPSAVSGECSGIVAIPVNTGTASFPTFRWEYRVNAASPWAFLNDGDLGGVVTGATTGTLVLINVPTSLSGYQFRAIVSNPCSALDFTAPPTTVTIGPLVARVSPTSATICRGTIQSITLQSPQSTFCSGTVNINVPDNNPNGILASIPVSGIPTSATITEVRVTFNMTHTWVGDMVINLRAPNGQTINLIGLLNNGTGSNGTANFVNTSVSSDNTFPPMSGAPAPRTGVFRADRYNTVGVGPNLLPTTTTVWGPLMNAATINGNWTLGMADLGPADLGVLQNWCITISYGAPVTGIWSQNPAPAPPNQYQNMWINSGATIPYTGTPVSQIWVTPTANTVYTVVASTVSPACTSAPVQIPVNVTQPLTNVVAPTSQTVCVGGTTSFSVTATSAVGAPYNGPFTYQWQETRDNGLTWSNVSDGGVYSGATTATLTLTGVTRSAPSDMNLYKYRCVVAAPPCAGSTTTAAATLNVLALPVVTISATDLALTPGQYSTITATSSPAPNATTPNWVWTRDGATIAGATTGSVTADINKLGVYRVSVTDINGCRNSSNSVLIESEVSDRLWIYPNPTTGKFEVRLYYAGALTEKRRVVIYNNAGQEISSKDFPLSNTTPHYMSMNFDLSNMAGGVYVIKVYDLYDKKHVQGLLIKQ